MLNHTPPCQHTSACTHGYTHIYTHKASMHINYTCAYVKYFCKHAFTCREIPIPEDDEDLVTVHG